MNVVDLTMSLCQIDSTTGKEGEVCQWLSDFLKEKGMQVQAQLMNPDDNSRFNILATWPGQAPDVLLSTHLDCVPPFIEPQVLKDRLTGRGTCDAKGIAAAMITACFNLKKQGNAKIGLLFLLEEETCSAGAKLAKNNFAPEVKCIINGEPTELKLTQAAKGAVVFDLKTKGKPGHSAYPETGYSAVHILTKDMQCLIKAPRPEDSVLGETTLNFGTVGGGIAANVFAPSAQCRGLIRTVVGLDEIEKIILANLSPETTYEFISYTEPMHFHTVNDIEPCIVAFGSDAPHLKSLGKIMLIGPGSILDAHTAHEHVMIDDLYKAIALYEKLCLQII